MTTEPQFAPLPGIPPAGGTGRADGRRAAFLAAGYAILPDGVLVIRAPYVRAASFAGFTSLTDQVADAEARKIDPAYRVEPGPGTIHAGHRFRHYRKASL
jgi:hypothetical protein